MRRAEHRKVVSAYVTDRLGEECKVRGRAAEIARAVHFTRVHVAAIARGDHAAGDDFLDAIAAYWSMTRKQLDDAAAAWADKNGVDLSPARPSSSGRLRERPEWEAALTGARSFFRGIPDVYFERVGMIYDDVPQRIDSQFIGEMARIMYDLALREDADPPTSTAGGPVPDLTSTKLKKSSKR